MRPDFAIPDADMITIGPRRSLIAFGFLHRLNIAQAFELQRRVAVLIDELPGFIVEEICVTSRKFA